MIMYANDSRGVVPMAYSYGYQSPTLYVIDYWSYFYVGYNPAVPTSKGVRSPLYDGSLRCPNNSRGSTTPTYTADYAMTAGFRSNAVSGELSGEFGTLPYGGNATPPYLY